MYMSRAKRILLASVTQNKHLQKPVNTNLDRYEYTLKWLENYTDPSVAPIPAPRVLYFDNDSSIGFGPSASQNHVPEVCIIFSQPTFIINSFNNLSNGYGE